MNRVRAIALCMLLIAAPAAAKLEPSAMQWALEHTPETPGMLGAYLVEAQVANGIDPHRYPASAPAIERIAWPTPDDHVQAWFRPLVAWQLAGEDGRQTPAGDGIQQILERETLLRYGASSTSNMRIWALHALQGATNDAEAQQAVERRLAPVVYMDSSGAIWSWNGKDPDIDTTGMALQALAKTSQLARLNESLVVAHIAAFQQPDGGFSYHINGTSNCNSTVWAIHGYLAFERTPPANAWSYLAALHRADGGYAFQADQPSTNPLCTLEVATLQGQTGHRFPHDPDPAIGKATPFVPPAALLLGLLVAQFAAQPLRTPRRGPHTDPPHTANEPR